MARIGIYLGHGADEIQNVTGGLTKWGEYLSREHELDGFGSSSVPASAREFYSYVKTDAEEFRTPFTKLLQVYRDCLSYQKRRSPDVIVQFWKYKTHGPGVALAGKRTATPTITRCTIDTANEFRGYSGVHKLGELVLNNCIGYATARLSTAMIALGPYGRQQLVRRGANPEDIVVLPPPIESERRFNPPADKSARKNDLGLPTDKQVAVYVGRLTKMKGMDFLESVINTVIDEKDIVFVLVGDGPYMERFDDEYPDSSVRTTGYVEHARIDQYYKAADLYVHPSPFEGIPLVVLEALQSGVPVVARRAGDIPFVTQNTCNTPREMTEMILDERYSCEWRNQKYFSDGYQRQTLNDLVYQVLK